MVEIIKINMKEMKIILLIMAIILSSNSCEKGALADESLTLKKVPYSSNQLRIDGYYYLFDNSNTLIATYFLYYNGILLYGGGRPLPQGLNEIEEKIFTSQQWLEIIPEQRLKWGVFQIKGNEISFEKWYPSSGGPAPVYIRSGEILNDTTFVITQSIRSKTGEAKKLNEVYHFKEFAPKPDSTNNFVK